MTLIRWYH